MGLLALEPACDWNAIGDWHSVHVWSPSLCYKQTNKETFIVLEYEVCNFKTQNLAQFGLVGPNIGPNWGLYNKKCKFWLKIYQWLSKNFVLSEYGVCSSKIKDFAFRTYFGPIRSNISEECPVDFYFFGPMAWFYSNKFKIGLGLPGRVFLIFDLGCIPPQGAVNWAT